MSYKPYKPGDAIRRRAPVANVCIDCEPRRKGERLIEHYGGANPDQPRCQFRGCTEASAIERLAAVAADDSCFRYRSADGD